jgi:hypothetical protein
MQAIKAFDPEKQRILEASILGRGDRSPLLGDDLATGSPPQARVDDGGRDARVEAEQGVPPGAHRPEMMFGTSAPIPQAWPQIRVCFRRITAIFPFRPEQDQTEWQIEWQFVLASAYPEPVGAGVGSCFSWSSG